MMAGTTAFVWVLLASAVVLVVGILAKMRVEVARIRAREGRQRG